MAISRADEQTAVDPLEVVILDSVIVEIKVLKKPYKNYWQFFSFGNLGGFNDIDKKTSNHIISLE